MADVINTTELETRSSVNEGLPPYNVAPWVVITRTQYDLWSAIPQRYRKWVVDHVEEMTQPEKDAIDLAEMQAARDLIVQQIDHVEDVLRAVVLMVVDELNRHADTTNALLDAIDAAGSLASLKGTVAGIQNLPTRTVAQVRSAIRNKLGQ